MSYQFDFSQLPLSVSVPTRGDRAPRDKKERVADPIPESQIHTVAFRHVSHRPDTLPDNCTAIWYTSDGIWLELDVGPASTAGVRKLPAVKIFKTERFRPAVN